MEDPVDAYEVLVSELATLGLDRAWMAEKLTEAKTATRGEPATQEKYPGLPSFYTAEEVWLEVAPSDEAGPLDSPTPLADNLSLRWGDAKTMSGTDSAEIRDKQLEERGKKKRFAGQGRRI